MTSAASLTSYIVRSALPEIVNKTPVAPLIESSSNGLSIAARAASLARSSPLALPIPIKAEPACLMIALTSAKSTLTKPGTVITSEIPCTPCFKTSSTMAKASSREVLRSIICNNLSLGMVMIVSTLSINLSRPCSAISRRCTPSKVKGLVTTATVKAPNSLAISAITGAAPVPVPPPKPQVIKTMSAPDNLDKISCSFSSALLRPRSGSIPAPKPRVVLRPICTL